ncbi:MAG TPA: SPOR domain-containing protein [Armatimonadota bacterium]|nr:SPOR domain-containing protein [Armatimonadota bacterium]
MSQKKPTLGERLMEGLRFWAVVLVICGVVGLASYTIGKRYVGSHLHEMEVKEGAPEITPMDENVSQPAEENGEPPDKAVVTMHEREPTPRERREAEQELSGAGPQDGAELHAAEAAQERDETPPPASAEQPPPQDEGASAGRKFVVSAGSFANEDNAQALVSRLAEMGYQPYVTHIEKDGMTYSRVNVGEFPSRDQAQEVADKLRSSGLDAAVYSG